MSFLNVSLFFVLETQLQKQAKVRYGDPSCLIQFYN